MDFESFKIGDAIRFRLKDNPKMIFGTIQTLFKKSEKMKIKVKNDSKQYEFKDLIKPEKSTKTDVKKYENATFLEKGDKVIFKPPWIKSLVPGEITGRTAEGKWKISSPTGQFTIANDNLLAQVKKGQGRRITERQYELAVKALKNKQEDARKQAAAAPEEATPSLPEEATPPPKKKPTPPPKKEPVPEPETEEEEEEDEDEDDGDYTAEELKQIQKDVVKMTFFWRENQIRKIFITKDRGLRNVKQTEKVKESLAKNKRNLDRLVTTQKEYDEFLKEYEDDVDNFRNPYDLDWIKDFSKKNPYDRLKDAYEGKIKIVDIED